MEFYLLSRVYSFFLKEISKFENSVFGRTKKKFKNQMKSKCACSYFFTKQMSLTLSDGSVAEAQRILDCKDDDYLAILKLSFSTTSSSSSSSKTGSKRYEGITPEIVRTAFDEIKKVLLTRHSFDNAMVMKAKVKLDKAYTKLSSQQLIDMERDRLLKAEFAVDQSMQEWKDVAKHTFDLESRMKVAIIRNANV